MSEKDLPCAVIIPFGRFHDRTLGDIPRGYLRWLLPRLSSKGQGELKAAIQRELGGTGERAVRAMAELIIHHGAQQMMFGTTEDEQQLIERARVYLNRLAIPK